MFSYQIKGFTFIGGNYSRFSLFSVLKSWLLKEFLFSGKISVTYSEVIAFYIRAEASPDAAAYWINRRERRERSEKK